MKLRIEAMKALRLNYKRRGVWVWLKGRQRCRPCRGEGRVPLGVRGGLVGLTSSTASFTARPCPSCNGSTKQRGYQRILHEPKRVIQEQHAIAGGAM